MLKKKAAKWIRNVDSFGHPIQLTYKSEESFKTIFGGVVTLLTRLILIVYLCISLRAIFDKDAATGRQLSSTDVVRTPDNFTMNYTNFQMAIRPYFQVSKHLDFKRYYRIIYGPEYYTWQGESISIVLENSEGVTCERDMFTVSDEEWEQFALGKAYCPNLDGNFYISGQWSSY